MKKRRIIEKLESNLIEVRQSNQKDISSLFGEAKDKLVKIDKEANQKKKDIVINLAKDLEGKIPTDCICQKIVEELNGIVSRSLIQNCLPEKYKQGYRVKNAKQQQIKNSQKEEIKLAPVVALNPEEDEEIKIEESHKNQVFVFTDTNGLSYLQWEDNSKESPTTPADNSSTVEGKRISQTTNKSQQQEQDQRSKRSSQLETNMKDKIVVTEESGLSCDTSSKDILPFEFSIGRTDIQNYLDVVESNTVDRIWFNGIIELNTKEVTSLKLGRLNQQDEALKENSIINNTTISTAVYQGQA